MKDTESGAILNQRQSVMERGLPLFGFCAVLFVGFALLEFNFYRLAVVLLLVGFAIKIPGLLRVLLLWSIISLSIGLALTAPNLSRLAATIPSQQARPFVVWFAFAAVVLALVGFGISRLERLAWPTSRLVALSLSLMAAVTILLIVIGVALGTIPYA